MRTPKVGGGVLLPIPRRPRGFHMIGNQASKSLALVAMLSSVSALTLPAPVAHADVLDDIRGTVTADRLKRAPACPPLKYNNSLQDIGFAQGQLIPDSA